MRLLRFVLIILLCGILIAAPVESASWRDPTITTFSKRNLIDMVLNITEKDQFILDNRTEAENTAAQMVRANLTLGGNISVPDTSTPNAIVIFSDTLGHVFKDSTILISSLITTVAPTIKEVEDQFAANDTAATAAAVAQASYLDTVNVSATGANISTAKAAAIKWASDSDTANRTGAENTASIMALANRTAAENTAAQMIRASLTLGGNISVPVTSVADDIVTFFDTAGHILKDSGVLIASLAQSAPIIKEVENQFAANDTHMDNLAKADTWFNLSKLVNSTYSDIAKAAAVRTSDDHTYTNRTGPEVLVAASDSPDSYRNKADYLCDGTADDVQIQAALGSLTAMGGTLNFAPGNYYIASTVTWTTTGAGTPLHLKGRGAELILAAETDVFHFYGSGDGISRVWYIVIDDLEFNGAGHTGNALVFRYGDDIALNRLIFWGILGNAIRLESVYSTKIDNSGFNNIGNATGRAAAIEAVDYGGLISTNLVLTRSIFEDPNWTALNTTWMQGSFISDTYFEGGLDDPGKPAHSFINGRWDTSEISNNFIQDNTAGSTITNINISGVSPGIVIIGNDISKGAVGIHLQNSASRTIISNNNFNENTAWGILDASAGFGRGITDNVFYFCGSGAGNGAIREFGWDTSRHISDNTIVAAMDTGIYLTEAHGMSVQNNHISQLYGARTDYGIVEAVDSESNTIEGNDIDPAIPNPIVLIGSTAVASDIEIGYLRGITSLLTTQFANVFTSVHVNETATLATASHLDDVNVSATGVNISTAKAAAILASSTFGTENLTNFKNLMGNISFPAQSIIPEAASGPTMSAPNTTGMTNGPLNWVSLDFGNTQPQQNATFGGLMPSEWNGGTLTARMAWTSTGGGGIVEWNFRGMCGADNNAMNRPWGANTSVQDTMQTINAVHTTGATGATTMGGTVTKSGMNFCWFQVARLPGVSGGMTAPAHLLGVQVGYGIT